MKDSVRSQCSDWKKGALRDGDLFAEVIKQSGSQRTIRITGSARLKQSGRGFDCQIHGQAVFDSRKQMFTKFELIAAGQRSGRDQFNARQNDLGPAPMGVAYRLHK